MSLTSQYITELLSKLELKNTKETLYIKEKKFVERKEGDDKHKSKHKVMLGAEH